MAAGLAAGVDVWDLKDFVSNERTSTFTPQNTADGKPSFRYMWAQH